MKRKKYPTKTVLLCSNAQLDSLAKIILNIPIDPGKPIEVVVREHVKARGLDQNALMWAGALKDIAEQAYVEGKTYSAEVWHEQFKREYLPEDDEPNIAELVIDASAYRKYATTANGNRVLIGSTTQLSKRGMALYLEQVYAFGSGLGVQFHTVNGV